MKYTLISEIKVNGSMIQILERDHQYYLNFYYGVGTTPYEYCFPLKKEDLKRFTLDVSSEFVILDYNTMEFKEKN